MVEALICSLAMAGRVLVALIFLAAALSKLRHRVLLDGVVANYRLLPPGLVRPVALLLPPLELAVAALLLAAPLAGSTPLTMISAGAAQLLLLAFAAAMAINLRRGRGAIDCGCGQSALRQELRWALVVRNGLLAAVLLPALVPHAADPPASVSGAGAGLVFFLLYLSFNTVLALTHPSRRAA